MFLQLGARVGVLIDPDKLSVTIYRSSSDPVVLTNEDSLSIPELLPGWKMDVADLWPPVFD